MINNTVLVLRGGPSEEFDLSLETGQRILNELNNQGTDVVVDCDGVWHFQGAPKKPAEVLQKSDFVFNAIHGTYGEDGDLQRVLDSFNSAYSGSGALGAQFSYNKEFAKKSFQNLNLKTPLYTVVRRGDDLPKISLDIFRGFPMPVVIKPVFGGNSIGVSVARDYQSLLGTLISTLQYKEKVLVEEWIEGVPATCGIIENFRNERFYKLPQADKELTKSEKEILNDYAQKAHHGLGLRGYSRSDFIVSPKRGVYILEVNSTPALGANRPFSKALEERGINMKEFLGKILS